MTKTTLDTAQKLQKALHATAKSMEECAQKVVSNKTPQNMKELYATKFQQGKYFCMSLSLTLDDIVYLY